MIRRITVMIIMASRKNRVRKRRGEKGGKRIMNGVVKKQGEGGGRGG